MSGIRRAHTFTRREEIGQAEAVFRFRAVIDLTRAEIEAIPLAPGTPYAALMQALAPYIVGWNLRNGERPQPPPAVAGVSAFDPITLDRFRWLYLTFLAGIAAGYLVQPRSFGESIAGLEAMIARSGVIANGKDALHVA